MGSLSSRPSVPSPQPQVISVVQPTPAPAPVASIEPAAAGASQIEDAAEGLSAAQSQSEARTSSLLQRNRGRFGTVQTSFRGLLGGTNKTRGGKKTLLGE